MFEHEVLPRHSRRVALLGEDELLELAAEAAGLQVEWREDLQAFALVSGKWPRAHWRARRS